MTNIKILILSLLLIAVCGCNSDIKISGTIDSEPEIYPDYIGVTIPYNIAPLNFHIEGEGDYCAIISWGSESITIRANRGDIVIPQKKWREITEKQKGDSISVTVCRKADGSDWEAYTPFGIHISEDSIDPTLVYRLLPPLYGTWREIGIYQRDLESYDERPIYKNTAYHGNCVNCHSFCNRDAHKMLFHLRGPGGATYLTKDGDKARLDTKTDSTISNFTYPYWHPSGRYVAFSVNDIFQVFHTTDPNRTEVIDDASDIVVFDIERHEAFSSPLLKSDTRLETFPAFSPDGRTLYYCTAQKPDTLPGKYSETKYSICSIAFDPETRQFGTRADTLFNALSADSIGPVGSMSVPRPSPDGRWLVTTLSDYGQFKIWHKDADLWMYDIENKQWQPMTAANSDDVDSYHSWSGNSRWIVLSSRRDDGLYTRPYIAHVSADGTVGKAFMLPQKYPKKYYDDQKNSYNIPEFVDGKVDLNTREVVEWIEEPMEKVTYSH